MKIFKFKKNKKYELYLPINYVYDLYNKYFSEIFKNKSSLSKLFIAILFIPHNNIEKRYISSETFLFLKKSRNHILNDLRKLEKLGYLTKIKSKKRAIYQINYIFFRNILKKYKKNAKIKLNLNDLNKYKDIRTFITFQIILFLFEKKDFTISFNDLQDLLGIPKQLLRKTIKQFFKKKFINYPLIGPYTKTQFGYSQKNSYKTVQLPNLYKPKKEKDKINFYIVKNYEKQKYLYLKGVGRRAFSCREINQFTDLSGMLGLSLDSLTNINIVNKVKMYINNTYLFLKVKKIKNISRKYFEDNILDFNQFNDLIDYHHCELNFI